ncbi:MAG: UDP-N-acetylglucosamine:LPS N-acetylglucosamine transferase [Anaerosolibacter sp.]|jgi:processive 1,2-diacylglycerol beta-glucosyltransferase|uniref:MGDG synthase family glycosyltransferase n=1 Tax=Anaerosolibacter sp. TaxID=1872527 RepID=UPI00261D8DFE|nr:hypothetical protein [Anaerosolibacter sp.]MDF2545200.1 UDP-N-acetylglucosamine:LPS N-acetylglucosamine transferase [Anaerosolibacter sp.]
MNIAIVTASIGHGHNSVALALQETLHDDGYHNTQIFDILDDSKISQLLKSIYLEIVDKTPYLYSKIYSWTQRYQSTTTLINYLSFLCLKSLTNIKKVFKPDIFIFTHPFPVIGYHQSLRVPAWTIITDYSFHPIWFNPKIRGYFVANNEIQEQLYKTNYPMDRVFDTGIPLKKSFSNTKNIDRSHMKSDNHKPLILIMGGGLGIGGLKEIVEELDKLDYSFQSNEVALPMEKSL